MGFFNIPKQIIRKIFSSKNKCEKNMPTESRKWNKMWDMWDMWVKGKIESPYSELMEYSSGVNNGGHHCHLDNIANNRELKKYIDALITILPKPLKENIQKAYNAYNPDQVSDENVKILDKCDEVFYENEEMINKILQDRASKIKL